MELNDPSAAECLRILLDDQCRNLRGTAQRIESLHLDGTRAMQPAQWLGPARAAHDRLAEQMLSNLTLARSAASHAADESARAAATLAGRVG